MASTLASPMAGRGPVDHPLLQPDPSYWGFRDLTKTEAKAIDAEQLAQLKTQPPSAEDKDAA